MDKQIREISKKRTWKRILRRSVALLCAVVMLFTMNTLKRNADTLERIAMCGYTEHVHTASCFSGDVLVCGMAEHIHTDACYQESPASMNMDDLDIEVEAPIVDDTVEELDLSLTLDNFDLVTEDVVAEPVSNEAEEKVYRLGNGAMVSQIIEAVGLSVGLDEIKEVGAVENDEAHSGLIAVEKVDSDYRVRAKKDFDAAELALIITDDIYVVKLTDGIAQREDATPEVQPAIEEAPSAQIDAADPAVLPAIEDAPTVDAYAGDDEHIEVPVIEDEDPVDGQDEDTVHVEDVSPEAEQQVGKVEQPEIEDVPGEQAGEIAQAEQPAGAQGEELAVEESEEQQPVEEAVEEQGEELAVEEAAEEQLAEEAAGAQGEELAVEEADEEQPAEEAAEAQDEELAVEESAEEQDEEQPAEEVAEEQGEEQPAEEAAEDKGEEQPAEEAAEEQGEEQPAEEAAEDKGEEQPAEETADEQGEEQPAEETAEEQGEEQSAEDQGEDQPADKTVDEQGEEQPAEEATEEQSEEQSAEEATEEQGEEQPAEAQPTDESEPTVYTATIDLTDVETYPLSLNAMLTAATPEQEEIEEEAIDGEAQEDQAEEQTTLTIEYDEALLEVVEQDGDYLVTPIQSFESTQIIVNNGSRYELTLVNCVLATDEKVEDEGEQQEEAQDVPAYTATIDLTDATYPLSLNEMITAATPEQGDYEEAQEDQAEEQPTLTIEYDEALLEVVEQDGDYLVRPVQSFESTQIIVTNGSRYELTLVNCVLKAEEQEEQSVPVHTATIDLTNATYPLSLNELITGVAPEQAESEQPEEQQEIEQSEAQNEQQVEEQPTLTIDYDEALFEVAESDGDWLITPIQSFESTQITVTNGSRYELTLVNCALPDEAGEAAEEPEIAYPAQTFEGHTDYVKVSVTAPEGAFPEGTTMTVADVEDEQTITDIEETVSEDFVEVKRVHAVDISFWNGETEIEPLVPISVVISVAEIEEQQDAVVVHVDNEGAAEVVESQSEAPAGETEVTMEMPASEAGSAPSDAGEQGAGQPAEDSESSEEEQTEDVVFSADSFSVYAVVVTETIETKYIDDAGETWSISVGFTKEANIPAGAKLDVSEVESEGYLPEAEAALEGGKRVTMARFFDISILDGDGREVQPEVPVTVNISLDNAEVESIEAADHVIDNSDPVAVAMHFEEKDDSISVDVKETTETEEAVVFDADGFSVYGVVYTVDFHYGNYLFKLDGNGETTLSALFSALKINVNAAEATAVSFTDATLLRVARLEDGSDWTLTSLISFDSEEMLTVNMADGTTYEIEVTDPQQYSAYFNVNDPIGGAVYAKRDYYGSELTVAVMSTSDDSNKKTQYSIQPRSADEPTNAHLQATRGFYFVGWTKDGTTVIGNPAYLQPTVERATTYTAHFCPNGEYVITYKNPDGHGGIVENSARSFQYVDPNNAENKLTTQFSYSSDAYGATAYANYGYEFDGWYSDGTKVCDTPTFDPSIAKTNGTNYVVQPRFKTAGTVRVTYQVKVGRVWVTGNEAKYANNSDSKVRTYGYGSSDYQDIYRGQIPNKAEAKNTTTGNLFLGWRLTDENGRILTRNAILEPSEAVYEDTRYYADYVTDISKRYALLRVNDWDSGSIVASNSGETCTDHRIELNIETGDNWVYNKLGVTYRAVPKDGYFFDHWEYDGKTVYQEKDGAWLSNIDTIKDFYCDTDTSQVIHEITAVFYPITKLTFDMNEIQQVGNNGADWQHWVDVPWCRNNVSAVGEGVRAVDGEEGLYEITVPYGTTFTMPYPSSYRRVTQTNNGYNLLTHSFVGWRAEGDSTGTLYQPGDKLTAYSSWKYYAVWDAYFPGKTRNNSNAYSEARYRYNTNTCGFFVRLFDSTFDKGDTGTYTDCLFTTRLFLSGNGQLAQNDVNGVRFDYYGNSDAWEQAVINDIDSNLRAYANSGLNYHQWKNSDGVNDQNWHELADDTTIQLELDFPSDDFIFSRIRAWNLTAPSNRKIQINGHDIPQDMLTTDYFDIKWYVLKDQENSWHIDGMLIPKYAKLRVTKTFVGSATALDLAKSGFTLNVTETNPRSGSADTHQLVMGYNSGEITWTYTSNGTSIAGTRSGATWTFTHDGERFAKVTSDSSGNGIVWTLYHLIPMTAYTVTESAYDAKGYTTIKTYQIENTPQETSTEGGGDSASVDCVYNYGPHVSESSYQTVGFTNLYTTPFVMTLMKQDGTTLRGLSNVTFDFEVRQGDAVLSGLSIPRTSNADGQITIEFPHEAGTYSFSLVEREHEGYNAISTITGTATVDAQGAVTLSDVNASVSGDSVLVSVGSPDPSIVYVKNMPERKQVRVTKTWTDGSNGTVVMQLMRNGVTMNGMYITLPYSGTFDGTENVTLKNGEEVGRYTDAWTYQWTNLPAYINGREVVYSVQEEWIGERGGVDSIHYNIANDSSDGYADYIVNQSQTVVVNGETTYISVYVENTPDNGQVKFSKVDASGKAVDGAVFTLYKDSGNNSGPKIPLETVKDDQNQDFNATSDSNGVVTLENLPVGWYWMKESTAPVGYKLNENWYLVRINARNSAVYTVNQTTYDPDLSKAVQTIIDEPFTARVKVVKKGISDLRLSGAVFSLHRTETSEVPIRGYASLTTDANGEIDLGELKQGTYWLKEITAPEGYQLLTNRVAITVVDDRNAEPVVVSATLDSGNLTVAESSEVYSVTVPNEPTGRRVKLRKQDAVSEAKNLQGARFKIYIQYDADHPNQGLFDHTPYVDDTWINSSRYDYTTQEFISDETYGRFYVGYLPVGSYTIVETQAPNGYERIDEPFILTVYTDRVVWTLPGQSQQSTNKEDVYIKNIPIGSISVSKTVQVDGVDSTELAGQRITFGLFDSQPTAESIASQVYTMTLGHTATTMAEAFTGLHMGTYWVYEVDADNHPILDGGSMIVDGKAYTVSEATPNVTLESAGDSKVVTITNNYSTVDIPVMKIWDGNSKPACVISVDFTMYTDATYNTVAKDIYGVDAVVTLSSDNGWKSAFTDLPEKDNTGATIQYYLKETKVTCKVNDAATGNETTTEVTGNAITDMFSAVSGTYTGTNVDAQSVYYRTITNTRQYTSVDVEKDWYDGTWPEMVSSVKVTLKANNEAANVTADTNGNAATVTLTEATENAPNANKAAWTHLPKYDYDGNGDLITYTVEETAVTYDGTTYTSTSDIPLSDRFQITTNQPTDGHATITNELKQTEIKVLKQSSESPNQPLSGAEFTLERKNNGVYSVYGTAQTSGANGLMTFSNLPDGEYRLEETGIPAGYARTSSGKYIYFKIAKGVVTWDDTPEDAIKKAKDGVAYSEEETAFTVDNTPGVRLPSTGGTGTTIIYAAGLGLIVMAIFGLMLRRRKARDVIE